MSDLTAAQWREIEAESRYLSEVHVGHAAGRYISLAKLRTIIKRSRRSLDQNALLWSLYQDAIAQAGELLGGWSKEDIHEFMLGIHFGWDERKAFGRTRLKPKHRSSRLTKTEFSDFLETVVRTFAEQGIVLRLPNEERAA